MSILGFHYFALAPAEALTLRHHFPCTQKGYKSVSMHHSLTVKTWSCAPIRPINMLLPNLFVRITFASLLSDAGFTFPLACAVLIQLCQVALRQVSRVSSNSGMQAASHQQAEHHSPMIPVMVSYFNSIYASADSKFVPSIQLWKREIRDPLP
jgi:hypothetical protein